jgi:hypothetical protein
MENFFSKVQLYMAKKFPETHMQTIDRPRATEKGGVSDRL